MTKPAYIVAQLRLPRRQRVLFVSLVLVLLTFPGCAVLPITHPGPPSLRGFDAVEQVADVDLLAVSPAMEAFLERYILPYRSRDTRLRLLTMSVVGNGVLGFEYIDTITTTAEEAFRTRAGNCVSHANMLIALARRAGLDARYQEVAIPPEWTSREHTVFINKHINVALASPHRSYEIDISGRDVGDEARRKILSDRDGKAMYFNNLGAVALAEDDLAKAYAYIVKAIDTAPQLPDPWVNLGVVFSRNQQYADAEMAHRTALELDANEYSAMNNLHALYVFQKKHDAAEKLQRRVDRYRKKNPYYLLMLSVEALEQSRFEESTSLLERAIRLKEDDHRLHFALAKSQYLSGDKAAAERSLLRAQELAPDDVLIDYTMPLDQLVHRE